MTASVQPIVRKAVGVVLWLVLSAGSAATQDGSPDRVLGTPHDLKVTFGTTEGSCIFCHIPSASSTNGPAGSDLAWNHEVQAGATYRGYASVSQDAFIAPLQAGNALQFSDEQFYSLACLSCHDGQTAVNVVYSVPDSTGTGITLGTAPQTMSQLNPARVIGPDLRPHHPVNFTYDEALVQADRGLWHASIGSSFITAVRPELIYDPYEALQQPILFNGTMQCASCHNPHSETNQPFLRTSVLESHLCLKCHSISAAY